MATTSRMSGLNTALCCVMIGADVASAAATSAEPVAEPGRPREAIGERHD